MIQARTADDKLLIEVTGGNVRNNHISIAGHYSFFPRDVLGKARQSAGGTGKPIFIHLSGLNKIVETDIGCEAKTGKPRRPLARKAKRVKPKSISASPGIENPQSQYS